MPETVEDLGKLVKGKYPGAYDALPDIEVGRKVKAKYTQYSQFTDVTDKPKLTPRTPQETKQFLQERYPEAYKEQPSVTRQVLTGVGKGVASDLLPMLSPALVGVQPEALKPSGPGEEAGSLLETGATIALPAARLGKLATQTVTRMLTQPQGVVKVHELIRFARHPFREAAIKALEQILPEEAAKVTATKRPGLKAPKYGGPVKPFDEGASRLTPRKPATLPVEAPFEPFKPNPKTAAKLRSGGAPEPFDEGASRLPVKRKLEPKAKPKLKGKMEATPDAPVKPTPATGSGFDTGSEPSVTSIKHEARHTDAMRAVFANARNLGVDSKALRAAAKEFYGKGISEMTYEEVVDLNERLLMHKAVPKK